MFDIYIHSNKKNTIPAKVGKYTFEKLNDKTVEIVNMEFFEKLMKKNRKQFIRNNNICELNTNSSQSFFLVRFLVPYYHKYILKKDTKWLLVTDPDIFCIKPINEELDKYILEAESKNKDIICYNNLSSFMLINTHNFIWNPDELLDKVFDKKDNFDNYMLLKKYDSIILDIPEYFNHYDKLDKNTKCLHTSLTTTQPWKCGLPYLLHDLHNIPYNSKNKTVFHFDQHKNKEIENKFFELFNETYKNGEITDEDIKEALDCEGLRKDYKKFII